MRGKINKEGFLQIERKRNNGSLFMTQQCVKAGTCGDWCPAFREPFKFITIFHPGETPDEEIVHAKLQLCNEVGKLDFEEGFIDERTTENQEEEILNRR